MKHRPTLGRILRVLPFAVLAILGSAGSAVALQGGALLRDVVHELEKDLYDRGKRALVSELAGPLLRRAEATRSEREERALVHELLEGLQVSHLALYSVETYDSMFRELNTDSSPMLGMQLLELEGAYHACWIYEGGPAERAGVLRGDRVVEIDGQPTAASPRLDWRSDDAALPDPPLHNLLCDEGEVVQFLVESQPGEGRELSIAAEDYSGWRAALESVRVFEQDGLRIGYLHFWFIPFGEPGPLLRKLIGGVFSDVDALLFDLRGRGGSASQVRPIVAALKPSKAWDRPVICLTDRGTRSAKEVIADELQRLGVALVVGEPTAGAVIPATFREVGKHSILMFPTTTLGRHTQKLEGSGVVPDVEVQDSFPFNAGADPILAAGRRAAVLWARAMQR